MRPPTLSFGLLLALTVWAQPAAADEKKADEKKADEKKADEKKADEKKADEKKADEKKADADPFGDLFGDSLTTGDKPALKDLTKDISGKKRNRARLDPKRVEVKDKPTTTLDSTFAAASIRMDRRRGCEPADRARTKVVEIVLDEVPSRGPPFAVCLRLSSDAGRQMRITTKIVSPKNRPVGRAESIVDFTGKPSLDHVMEFPQLEFKQGGQYYYQVDLDGRPHGRLPLFVVRVDPDA